MTASPKEDAENDTASLTDNFENIKSFTRDDLVRFAKISEQAERFQDMAKVMKILIMSRGSKLDVEERTLLSVAYKHLLGACRSSWRVVTGVEMKLEDQGNTKKLFIVTQYRQLVEAELNHLCEEVLGLLQEHLIPSADNTENKVFYFKMQGDYLRYMAEVATGDERKGVVESSELSYKTATEIASNHLAASNPIRLGLALNYAIFYYDTRNDSKQACQMVRETFDDALDLLDTEPEGTYNDSALIMQLLRDNLARWTAEQVTNDSDEG